MLSHERSKLSHERSNRNEARPECWRNRIVGHGEARAADFLANPNNWRVHPRPQQEALAGVLSEVGWVQQVIVNRRTASEWGENQNIETLLDGHLRVTLALRQGDDTPVPVLYVDLTPSEEAEILATLDPIAAMAVADKQQLEALLREVRTDDDAVRALLSDLAGLMEAEDDDLYTRKIQPPIYEPSGARPAIGELYDDAKTRRLVDDVEGAEALTAEERHFLTLAAQRHTVFRFDRIADYYAQASPAVQRLMEDSALVIIDFQRAIENGFVQLSDDLVMQVRDEYGDE